MTCKYLTDRCEVISKLCGKSHLPSKQMCKVCRQMRPSQSVNVVTIGQAIAQRSLDQEPCEDLDRLLIQFQHFGPGTELKKMLSWFSTTGSCNCLGHATLMNRWGPKVCRQNMNTIAGWLVAEAKERAVPTFVSKVIAKAIVREAIRRAERTEQKGLRRLGLLN